MLAGVQATVCTNPESASTPMCAFIPKYQLLPFLVCFISGSRSPEAFLVELGAAISVASTAGQTGVEGQANYAAAKAGVIGASKALAREVAKRGVTVNVLAPGFIETDMTSDVPRDQMIAKIPAGRFGKPEEVAAAAAFLCSDGAAYITGAVLNINGGVYT